MSKISDDLMLQYRNFRQSYEMFRTYGDRRNNIQAQQSLAKLSFKAIVLRDQLRKEAKTLKDLKKVCKLDDLLHIKKKVK